MNITNVKISSDRQSMTCELDGRAVLIPREQKPTLINNGYVWVKFRDGNQPILLVDESQPLLFEELGRTTLQGVVSDPYVFDAYVKSFVV